MKRTYIKKETLRYALEALDAQRANIAVHGGLQMAYYDGMRNMLDIILTDAYSATPIRHVVCNANGHHTVHTGPEKANPA